MKGRQQTEDVLRVPPDKSPSLRQLKSTELEFPLLRHGRDDGRDSAAEFDNDEDEEQEITLH